MNFGCQAAQYGCPQSHQKSVVWMNNRTEQAFSFASTRTLPVVQSKFVGFSRVPLPTLIDNTISHIDGISTVVTDFSGEPTRNGGSEVSCSTAAEVRTLCTQGQLKKALQILDMREHQGLSTPSDIVVSLLQQCIRMKALAEGTQVYFHIIRSDIKPQVLLGNKLVNIHVKFGNVMDARQIFDKMPERNVVSWTVMIAGYAQHGHNEEALKFFQQMQREGVAPDKITFVCVINVCAHLATLKQGREVHEYITNSGFESDVVVGSALVNMYSKCGSIELARQVFDRMHVRNVVSWTALIGGYSQHGDSSEALKLFRQMQQSSVEPDKVIYVCAVKACAGLGDLKAGKQMHALIINSGFESDVTIGSTLVDMYSNCGCLEKAQQVFDKMPTRNCVSWNAMITGYVLQGHGETAIKLFWKMGHARIERDEVTCTIALNACASIIALDEGKKIHAYIVGNGIDLDLFIGSALVHMYAKCGSIEFAREVFDQMLERDLVVWNAMISGYGQHGNGKEALEIFWQMTMKKIEPNDVSYLNVLKACAGMAELALGTKIHVHIIESGFESHLMVGNALVDMYSKCGSLQHAQCMFDKMLERDIVSWNAIITGYALYGNGKEVLQLVEQMQREGLHVDPVTCSSILTACSHAGLMQEGCLYFNSMRQVHGIMPTTDHYACMVDLLGRSGHLEEAAGLIETMPFQPNVQIWVAFLGACRINGNVELAKYSVERILKLDPDTSTAYILLSNMYAASGRLDDNS